MKNLFVCICFLFSVKVLAGSCTSLFSENYIDKTLVINELNLKGLNYNSITSTEKSSEQLKDDLYNSYGVPVPKPISFTGLNTLPISEIFFMQGNARSKSSKSRGGYLVTDNAQKLRNSNLSVKDLPMITVWKDTTEKVWTLNHRRLVAMILSDVVFTVPVHWASTEKVLKFSNQKKFYPIDKGRSIDLIFVDEKAIVKVTNTSKPKNKKINPFNKISLVEIMNQHEPPNQEIFNRDTQQFTKNLFISIGKGYRGNIWKNLNNQVFKVARKVKDTKSLLAEYLVNQHLKKEMSVYNIHTDNIVKHHPDFIFLEKELIPNRVIAKNLLKVDQKLSKIQYEKLQQLFENAKKYAKNTGIGLDLKSSNLYWNIKLQDWVIFDLGPRFSYLPYGFTKDIQSFSDYLKIWSHEEPQ